MNNVWNNLDPLLAKEAKDVLWRLQLLSYSPGNSIVLKRSRSADRGGFGAPGSLYDDFVAKFAPAVIAGDEPKVRSLIIEAETEITRYKGQYKAEMELPTDDEDAMARVVAAYEGRAVNEVARRLLVPPKWVKKARKHHRRDEATGLPLAGWAGWDDDTRLKEVQKAIRRGLSLRRASEELGVPRNTLHRKYGHHWEQTAA